MILLNSIWLFALAALGIPVAIHLWNIKRGKTLKVGSISLITAASQNSRSLKLHDLLLLLLRCLLLALVAFVLAMPSWQRHISTSQLKGWVLIPKESLKETYQKFKPEIDSLNKAGYEFHYFNQGFEKADLNKALTDTISFKHNTNASYWTLVQQLDGQVPSSLPVYLFTSNKASYFKDEKPEVALNLHWQTYTLADSTSSWIAKAWLTNNNDIHIIEGNSKANGTFYTDYAVQSGNPRNTPFVVSTDNGKLTVSLKNANLIAVDTSTWRFAIYADRNSPDAGYIRAALESVIQFTKHKAVIKQYTDAGQIPAHQSWIFWLSNKPAAKQLVQNCGNLFTYETGKVNDINSWINDGNESLSKSKIGLYKSIELTHDGGQAIWQDGFGNQVLSLEKQQQINLYHFYSRFDPSWSDLVWSNDFPKMMLKLIVNPTTSEEKYDRRVMDAKQLMPVINNEDHATTGKIIEQTDLTRYFWILLVAVFVTERWFAHRSTGKKILKNG
ncbi:BatA domain-containing protein [Mucilaginibacter sp. McL0603]|uniref:BatA domain-containing protein n=1 Tax=Mucilaginibacter sp. McL0603 TaxID=3415670 RepID=UPI003CEDC15D